MSEVEAVWFLCDDLCGKLGVSGVLAGFVLQSAQGGSHGSHTWRSL